MSRSLTCQDRGNYVHLQRGDVRWVTHIELAPILETLLSGGVCIKESPAKLVTVHRHGDQTFYVKRYRYLSIARSLKYLFKASQARREWELAWQLEKKDIPVVRHLALGERWNKLGLQESILVTLGFEGQPLDEASQVCWNSVAKFVARMHDAGVLQKDLHPGNILINPCTAELRLVDLKGMVIRSCLSNREREENLAFLRIFVPVPVGQNVQHLSWSLRQRVFAERAKRCCKLNREFAPFYIGNLKWQVRLPFAGAALSEIEAAPDRLLGQKAFTIKTGRTSSVGCKGAFVLKRYNSPGAANLFKNIFRSSRSRRAYRKGYHLELLGIPTPRSVATADRRIGPALRCSYLITESIPGAQELGAYLRCVDHPDKQVIYLTAQLLAQLHQEGFSHGDLKERNILLDSQLKPYIIDLDALRYRKGIHDAAAAGDLQRLNRALESYPNIGRWERFAFLRHYCRRRNLMRVPVPY